jgi:hypothetical protein
VQKTLHGFCAGRDLGKNVIPMIVENAARQKGHDDSAGFGIGEE